MGWRGRRVSSGGADRDIGVRMPSRLCLLLVAMSSCRDETPVVQRGGASGALVDVADLYVYRGARLTVRAAASGGGAPDSGVAEVSPRDSDFQVTTQVSADGSLMGATIAGTSACPTPVGTNAATSRRLVVPGEYSTIQAAVDAAAAGDVVFVQSGVYHENIRLRSHVSLIGAGAATTTLDGAGKGISLVDYTGASNTVLQGFTLTNVGTAPVCAGPPLDPFRCSGDWYAAAVFGDGHARDSHPCADTSILITQNIIRGNAIGVMAYYHARSVIRNNIFVGNMYGFVANHLQDHALLLNNAFVDNEKLAIGSQAAYLDVIGNIIAGSEVGVSHEFVQMGRISCNAFAFNRSHGDRVPIGQQNNLSFDSAVVNRTSGNFEPTPELVSALAQCLPDLSHLVGWGSAEPGAFGGTLGNWLARGTPPAPTRDAP